jgi:hypothetical protein
MRDKFCFKEIFLDYPSYQLKITHFQALYLSLPW